MAAPRRLGSETGRRSLAAILACQIRNCGISNCELDATFLTIRALYSRIRSTRAARSAGNAARFVRDKSPGNPIFVFLEACACNMRVDCDEILAKFAETADLANKVRSLLLLEASVCLPADLALRST